MKALESTNTLAYHTTVLITTVKKIPKGDLIRKFNGEEVTSKVLGRPVKFLTLHNAFNQK